eukprot:4893765-Amphidinium_carterae.2
MCIRDSSCATCSVDRAYTRDVAQLMSQVALRGPIAGHDLHTRMQWINKHLGMTYPLDTPLLEQWQKPPKNHLPSQRLPHPEGHLIVP